MLSGPEETIDWFRAQNFWGEEKHNEQLEVPRALIVAISERWQKTAQKLNVPVKKELFYRFMLPLVVHANTMVLNRRERLQRMQATIVKGDPLADSDETWLCEIAVLLRIANREEISTPLDSKALGKIIDQALYKLDVIPAGLALGQAAYESGYGTSRFAVKGNALFGQWTFGGEGLTPEQQRKELGDHRIASFEWPFDSVRGYFINLCAHPAYEDFRRIRAENKAAGKKLSSLALAEGLKNYSERGQAYVDTLKGIIRKNNLQIADDAVFKDEPMRFVLGEPDPAAAEKLRSDIEAMRQSGKLEAIITRMRLE
ncbi:glucosaminidase [Desulfosarcina widdelii]|uniref:Glucosaminidase n=1 Tax=Desulfosarcina widdelii TaxID=947919 RepID=A0A5K7ZEG8_9BACT|nr:glucosaminidase domain-containing protein [Desulfosarcina widdelii]BBO78549.1 glucosaminidase [Desulfosarcina widdelii]